MTVMLWMALWVSCGVPMLFHVGRLNARIYLSQALVSLLFGPAMLGAVAIITAFDWFEDRGFDPVIWRKK